MDEIHFINASSASAGLVVASRLSSPSSSSLQSDQFRNPLITPESLSFDVRWTTVSNRLCQTLVWFFALSLQ